MKGYYIYNAESDFRTEERPLTGVEKKILMQLNAFDQAGLNPGLLFAIHVLGGLRNKISSRMPFGSDHVLWPSMDKLKDADWVYIRKPYLMSRDFRRFLRALRKTVPQVKLLLELPTYPYDAEVKKLGWKYYPWLWRERYNRVRLRGLVDRIVLVANTQEELWGLPTLSIVNGIDLSRVRLRTPQNEDDIVRILCAANFMQAHGIDRFLAGMEKYYENGGTRQIQLHLAGSGPEYPHLISQSKNSRHLAARVVFHGMLDSSELEVLYDQCDMAIEALACFRKDLYITSTLKTREYMAAGLPFFSDAAIDILEQPSSFVHTIPAEESPIDIEEILRFYDRLYPTGSLEEKKTLAYHIRECTKDLIDINRAMQPVTSYIKGTRR